MEDLTTRYTTWTAVGCAAAYVGAKSLDVAQQIPVVIDGLHGVGGIAAGVACSRAIGYAESVALPGRLSVGQGIAKSAVGLTLTDALEPESFGVAAAFENNYQTLTNTVAYAGDATTLLPAQNVQPIDGLPLAAALITAYGIGQVAYNVVTSAFSNK